MEYGCSKLENGKTSCSSTKEQNDSSKNVLSTCCKICLPTKQRILKTAKEHSYVRNSYSIASIMLSLVSIIKKK